ncbi:MAG: tetratricopeptide repeat protein [Chloroflexota bacterium]
MANESTVSFAELLKEYRRVAGLTQETMAERAGVSSRGIQALELGENKPRRDTARRLSTALGLSEQDRARFLAAATPGPRGRAAREDGTHALPLPVPVPRPAAPRHNLPALLSSFVGRDQEQADIIELLAQDRLVTLVGPGGVGKTRLALAAAAQALDRQWDGVWLVELAFLAETIQGGASLVPKAVADTLGLREEFGRPLLDTLADHLKEQSCLLLLDNCEHLIDACAALVGTLLRAAPALRVLATSRERLGVRGEATYRLLPLALPPDLPRTAPLSPDQCRHYAAVRLFTERARARLHTFELTEGNLGAVVALCRGLDGLPLALELAAARIGTLTVEGMVGRLGDRFRLLAAGDRDLPPHQRTLRTTLQWSHDLLRPDERALFRRLAVFTGWTLEAAEAITAVAVPGDPALSVPGDVLDLLGELVNKSLVTAQMPPATAEHGVARYRLLETVSVFADECLAASGEGEAIRAAHAAWYTALAERAAPELRGALQASWLARLDADGENLRTALTWARDNGRIELGLRLATALWRYWYVRGRLIEGLGRLGSLLELARADATVSSALRAAALHGASSLAEAAGAYDRAAALAQCSLELCRAAGDRGGEGDALNNLGNVAREQGDLAAAERWFEDSLALGRAVGDPRGTARALNNLAAVRRLRGNLDDAESLALQSLVLRRAEDDRGGMAIALDNLAAIGLAHGDQTAARAHGNEALALWREVGDTWGVATGLATLSAVALGAGEIEAAERLAGESLVLWEALEDRRSAARVRNTLSVLATLRGNPNLAPVPHRENLRARPGLGDPHG